MVQAEARQMTSARSLRSPRAVDLIRVVILGTGKPSRDPQQKSFDAGKHVCLPTGDRGVGKTAVKGSPLSLGS